MNENKYYEVLTVFDMLLGAIEHVIDSINQDGAKAYERKSIGDLVVAHRRADHVATFRDKVAELRKEWESFIAAPDSIPKKQVTRARRRNLGRLQFGLCTPQAAFRRPILQALQELGGSAKTNIVLKKVELFMQETLKEIDYEPLPSKPFMLRWEGTAQWARHDMKEEGLLKPNSSRGVWEITDAGRSAINR